MEFVKTDGGRAAAGYKGSTRDCVVRAVAIASGLSYGEVYKAINGLSKENERGRRKSGSRTGVFTKKKWFKDYMTSLGFEWTACMGIGTGCKVHLADGELPGGRLVVSLSGHFAAVIDGVLHDNHDCSRGGTRCVYGYWKLAREPHVANPPPPKPNKKRVTPKMKVMALAEELGADVSGEGWDITVDAPDGYHWADSGVHCMRCDSWSDALDRMSLGTELCCVSTCELWMDDEGKCENDMREAE